MHVLPPVLRIVQLQAELQRISLIHQGPLSNTHSPAKGDELDAERDRQDSESRSWEIDEDRRLQ